MSTDTPALCWFAEHVTDIDIYLHGATSVLYEKRSPYQRLAIIDSPTIGRSLIIDNKLQVAGADEFLYHESLVHPACLACEAPRTILILGGGDGAALREALRWKSIDRAVMVDIDRDVIAACSEYLPEMNAGAFSNPRSELVYGDAQVFLENNSDTWDVIIADLSEPIEGGPSAKLFTKQAFDKVRSKLAAGGMFALQAGPVGPQFLELYTRLVCTMKAVFPRVIFYATSIPSFPAPWGFILGSNTPLDARPKPELVDEILRERTLGGFRMFDGETLLGLLQNPLYVREAVTREVRIFTLSDLPHCAG